MKPPDNPDEIKRLSEFPWVANGEGGYHLGRSDHSLLSVRQNVLGSWEVATHVRGVRSIIGTVPDLPSALKLAEEALAAADQRVPTTTASWRQEPPTQPQCNRIWQLDAIIRERFKTPDGYLSFCQRQYDSGDQDFSKGGVSSRIDALQQMPANTGKTEVAAGPGNKSDTLGCSAWLVLLALMGWGAVVTYSPHTKADTEALDKAATARGAVAYQFALTIPQADIRLEQLGGFNLEVWITQHDFDSMPYPDRKGFVERVGKAWCGPVEQMLLPSLAIRDVHNGKELASYSCVFSYASLD